MYRSDAFDPNYTAGLNAKFLKQEFEAPFTKANTADTTVYAMRRSEEAQTFGNCNLLNDTDPKYIQLGCDKSWVVPTTPGGWNCNTSASSTSNASTTTDGGKAYADKVYGSCSSGTNNAWTQCKADVIARAEKACVDPTFTLAIWLHESGASNYTCGKQLTGQTIEDFGIHNSSSAPPGDLSKQLDAFLKLPDAYAARCPGKTMQDFVAMYWIGDGCYSSLASSDKTKIDGYIGELKDIYASIAPGKSLPTWPKGSCSGSPL